MYLHTYMLKDKRHYSGATYHIHICMASFFTELLYAPMYVAIKCILEASTRLCVFVQGCVRVYVCVSCLLSSHYSFSGTQMFAHLISKPSKTTHTYPSGNFPKTKTFLLFSMWFVLCSIKVPK